MDQDAIVTKRLHVAGLTPAITEADLSHRLGTFGTIEALHGFGKLDGVGQPRRFAYVTLRASKGQLARCMNLLSGTTWKGTKLRIGEAKPDFHERIVRETEQAPSERPKKRRRLARGIQGVHAPDMSLVTPENVHLRKGWHVTPLGRLIRPMRMRPLRPLPLPTGRGDAKVGKKPKQRFKQALVRARRQSINPMRWGSQHLKGAFLDSENVVIVKKHDNIHSVPHTEEERKEDSDDDSTDDLQVSTALAANMEKPPASGDIPELTVETTEDDSLVREKMQSLNLLESMFGSLDEDTEWGGKETIDSDIEMGDTIPPPEVEQADPEGEPATKNPLPTPKNKLKGLFAPQEEQGFSLLGHLDLDLELEDEVIAPVSPKIQVPINAAPVSSQNASSASLHAHVTLDPKQPLFFPLSLEARSNKGKAKDITDVMKERGFDWRQGFYRTESSEEIVKRWEETKGELTRDWKRRHREAVKSQRRRGGRDDDF